MTLGTVSNGWAELLPGSSLEAECRRALEHGFRYVELRQRALGAGEERVPGEDRPWPLPDKLAALARGLPELGFNIAVEAPFLTVPVAADEPYLRRCAEAALALGGTPPVLRLVDLSPVSGLLEHEDAIAELGYSVAGLATALWKDGIRLALENSKQPVASLRAVLRRAAEQLPGDVPAPQVCWDAHNQISQTLLPEDPVETARAFGPEELFEFHFKQSRDGVLQGDVGEGDIAWTAILAAMGRREFRGPALFELPAGLDIWERLERSGRYVLGVGG